MAEDREYIMLKGLEGAHERLVAMNNETAQAFAERTASYQRLLNKHNLTPVGDAEDLERLCYGNETAKLN